ncbi:MAG TPA: adenylate/guanylate cyclase domain-containing protein [Oligoflexus sp.]|uniref:adenylate/guanylate cyclase domain-containing protein n=1 Tax=Oligoflexus sp. TaxID=1971216 RepID=UPI002D2FF939|nr:adenylate/guanylate cyclase domain-containing protein [Oligoflexus sp.]HYX31763.1 adenylate/guanylate cyclase domain-containing protein [Oligoflexus sp.]
MAEGYDGISLQANAYRIKEMGDGFLCSIGYPFRSKTENPANDALDIAKKFIQTLTRESQILHSEVPICCSIGIALDTLTGFYPESGTKKYDLFGPAIVLATRYEAMRKALFNGEMDRNVIIIQDVVYAALTRAIGRAFRRLI